MRAILHIGQRQLQKRQGERNAPVKYHTPNKRQLRSDYGVEDDVGVGLSSAGFEENDGDGVDEAVASLFLASSDRKSTRLNSSHQIISYAVFCLKKKKQSLQVDSITYT